MAKDDLNWRSKAEANLLQARERHSARLGSKKSRNGCLTCRSRRVKCDELRPSCHRCQSGGRQCRYDAQTQPTQGKNFAAPSSGLPVSQVLGLRKTDKRAFDYFISHTAPRLAGTWDKEFWCNNVLQVAQKEPFVVDSLLAISVLYEHPQYLSSFTGSPGEAPTPEYPGTSFEGTPVPDEYLAYALKLYNRSIQSLTAEMNQGKASHTVALLSCLLFICIETIRDNVLATMGLFMQGTNMLKHIDRSRLTSDEETMLKVMERTFQRMAVQAVLYGHPSGPSLRHDLQINATHNLQSLAEARGALFSHAALSYSFMREADAFRHAIVDAKVGSPGKVPPLDRDLLHALEMFQPTSAPSSTPRKGQDHDHYNEEVERAGAFKALRSFFDQLHPDSGKDDHFSFDIEELLSQKLDLLRKLDQWDAQFNALLKHLESEQQAPAAVSYLRMYHAASLIWVSTRLSTTESEFDHFTATFEKLVHHAEIYIRATAVQMPIFTFEIGAVLPLFLVASKCRVPSLRRRALDLILQCPRKESTFGAYSCAQALRRLISIEEDGLGLTPPDLGGCTSMDTVHDGLVVPEHQRIHFFDLRKDRKTRTYTMRITRYREVGIGLERIEEDFVI